MDITSTAREGVHHFNTVQDFHAFFGHADVLRVWPRFAAGFVIEAEVWNKEMSKYMVLLQKLEGFFFVVFSFSAFYLNEIVKN